MVQRFKLGVDQRYPVTGRAHTCVGRKVRWVKQGNFVQIHRPDAQHQSRRTFNRHAINLETDPLHIAGEALTEHAGIGRVASGAGLLEAGGASGVGPISLVKNVVLRTGQRCPRQPKKTARSQQALRCNTEQDETRARGVREYQIRTL